MESFVLSLLLLPLFAAAQDRVCRDNYGTPYREGEEAVNGQSWVRCWGGQLTLAGCETQDRRKIPVGQTVDRHGYQMTCKEVSPLTGHMTPTACIRDGRVLQPGQSVTTDYYTYTCRNLPEFGVSLDITACVDEEGRQVAPGQQVVRGDFQYQCSLADGYIRLRPTGCVYDGVSHPAGTTFDGDKFFFTCQIQGNNIDRRIDGCLDRNGRRVQPGATFHKNGFVLNCEQTWNGIRTKVTGCSQELDNGQVVDHPVGRNWVEGVAPFQYTVYCTTCTDGRTVMRSLTKCKMGGRSGTAFKTHYQWPGKNQKDELDPGCMRPMGASLACCGTTEGGGLRLHLDDYSPVNVEKWRQRGYRMC